MTKHYNTSISEDAARILNSKQDYLSAEVQGPIAVIPIDRIQNIMVSAAPTTSGASNNITTFAADKDSYVTGCTLSFQKDATCDVSDGFIRIIVTTEGVTRNIAQLPVMTLTAQSMIVPIQFAKPIKVDRGSASSLTQGTFTAGKFIRSATLYGYTVETTK